MPPRSFNPTPLLLAFGLVAFGVAGLSVADMFVPRPYDGVVLRAGGDSQLVVREVIPGSGAERAGIAPGDEILGIGRELVVDAQHAARILQRFRIGDDVPYWIRRASKPVELKVELDRRRIGDGIYFYCCVLGFSFFLVGLFVLVRQPTQRASQVFFFLCGLFLLFLVCRLRPPTYSGIDTLLLSVGTVAFLLLPPAFLHFYLLVPRPAWLEAPDGRWRALARLWRRGWPAVYALPPAVYGISWMIGRWTDADVRYVNGAPLASWWLLALFVVAGLAALGANFRRLRDARERRGMALVLLGSAFGLVPFLASTLSFAHQHSRAFFLIGILPLALVPLTFTYAIVRFQLLDVRVILRRSLLYSVGTALVTGIYAGGIATFNALFHGTPLAASGFFPLFLALAIVLLFDPFRRRLQEVIERFFFASRWRLERAMVELGKALTAQVDLQTQVLELVGRLPQLLGLRFVALYLHRGGQLERVAGPERLPASLPDLPELSHVLRRRGRLTRLGRMSFRLQSFPAVARLVDGLERAGVAALVELASKRRRIGLLLLSEKTGQMAFEREEIELLEGLIRQVVLALEASLLLEERTQQAELERELEIAAAIQAQLLPTELRFADGWEVAASCRPARIVGGDFFAQLPAEDGSQAVVYGDVSGKSVSGALMMMAAHEALYALAMTRSRPGELFDLANRRLYGLGRRSFVALGYFSAAPGGGGLRYLVAGQPAPLLRHHDGEVRELPLCEHRLPVGALADGSYRERMAAVEPGDVVLGYSDGVIEAHAPGGELFGEERLREVVAAAPPRPREIVDRVLAAVEDFRRGSVQYDDLTVVAVGRTAELSR